MIQILAIVGPTASGKTDLGLRLAQKQDGEIISVDSRQIYRFLSVGTAKPHGTWETSRAPAYRVQGIPYHLVDIWDPAKPFSAADFVRLAGEKIKEIRGRGKKPILVGGTGLYFKALAEGLAPLPPRDEALRSALHQWADEKGRPRLHQELARVDPEAAAAIPANNIARVIRALEVFKLTGKPISEWHRDHQKKKRPPIILKAVGNALSKEELHQRIERRCRGMIEQGLIEETEHLLQRGYAPTCPALSGLGYPRVIDFLKGNMSKDELRTLLARDTRQYAKRQSTWFRHQMSVQWKKS